MSFLAARTEVRQWENYTADLLWAVAKRNLQGDIPMPSEIWNNKSKIDRRSGKQIVQDLLKKLGGE